MTMLGHAIVADFLVAKIFVMGNSWDLANESCDQVKN